VTGFNHGMTGAVIALVIKQPELAIPLSFASHFACDNIPHFGVKKGTLFNRTFNIILVSDFLFAVLLMGILGWQFPEARVRIWLCMIAAASPDLMWAYYELYLKKIKHRIPKLDPLARFHTWIQWSQTPPGAVIEGVWFLGMSSIILALR
jgi:hypothetical protein